MGKVYTVVFTRPIGNDPVFADQTYFYDCISHLEQGKYRGTFSFMGSSSGTISNQFHPLVFIDLGQSNYTSFASSPTFNTTFGTINYTQGYIGSLETLLTGTNQTTYIASTETNPPFYLDYRPQNNLVNVRILNQRGFQDNLSGNNIGNYTLTLQLEKID